MFNRQPAEGDHKASGVNTTQPPTISLPKGGGAIRGIGEKFSANPVTGTGSLSVPVYTSPGRAGFGPQISLSYDSGAGNGPFGFGWNISLPSITRKTDKGLPQYLDTDESDIFILSGAEDLVPVLVKDEDRWVPETTSRTINGASYRVQCYRPRIEGLFARIERWTNRADLGDTYWRSISKDNITTWYGKTGNSRIADPLDPTRVFSWLICESYDDKGNITVYHYKEEDSINVDFLKAHEKNRTDKTRSANRYPKSIKYGNRAPYYPVLAGDLPPVPLPEDWLFEVLFDYGEHHPDIPTPGDTGDWKLRHDPFSSYRAGFEIRTYRLCRRVLMFHHFSEEEVGANCLVRSTNFNYSNGESPIFSFLMSSTQTGHKRKPDGAYLHKSLPPLEFEYSQAAIGNEIHEIPPESLENLPCGLDGAVYSWVDLDGEGLSGILTEQGKGWFYKRNLSPINILQENGTENLAACFGPAELVAEKPSLAAVSAGRQQFLDLAGEGRLDLVDFQGPTPGFFERTPDKGWKPFTPFDSLPVLNWDCPNLKFIDLTGDGHADILISEDHVFYWYPSLAEAGFGPPETVRKALDEEQGPRLVFAEATQSVFLADMSGDGLTDLVQIRNGGVCYWPNLGYGHFGSKVTMDNAPWFDHPEIFEPKRIQLADIDGSGLTDIIYLAHDGIHLYFNRSGNSWDEVCKPAQSPHIDNHASVAVVDLLGNGTACLVWSSPLPGGSPGPMRYIDLMGGQKPHLLVLARNNLGAETHVKYAPSTKFYLADKLAGKPWITKLPFPVHCVEKMTVQDKWRKTTFTSTYSYHHGYYDSVEREFRGFGRVEQTDVESFDVFAKGNAASPYITDDRTLYQPPVMTVTWFHTGAFLDRERILSHFQDEYFPNRLDESKFSIARDCMFKERALPEPDFIDADLSLEEWREALRAYKGTTLRQEVYELDLDSLQAGQHIPVKLFTATCRNCQIRRIQPLSDNKHAVFLVTESETITYHYDLDLRRQNLQPDPRVAHTLNLRTDEYGNVLQSVAAVYPRTGRHEDSSLPAGDLDLIVRAQQETHISYTENRYTNDINDAHSHRLRLICEAGTYELTGIIRTDAGDQPTPDTPENLYLTIDKLRRYRLSGFYDGGTQAVADLQYHEIPDRATLQKRLVDQVRILYFDENLQDPLPFGILNRLGLLYETYRLALTDVLLDAVFSAKLTQDIRDELKNPGVSGYLSGADLNKHFGSAAIGGQYWVRSGIAGFAAAAGHHFFLPECYTDPFGNLTTLQYDSNYHLFIESSTDPAGNTTRVERFDYRVLTPGKIRDINNNLTEVVFDILGMPTAMALNGKGAEGDSLDDFDDTLSNPDPGTVSDFFTGDFDEAAARRLLGSATARHVYCFGEQRQDDGSVAWGHHPAGVCGILRERYVAELSPGEQSPLQAAFEYSDGMGTLLVKKAQAEPIPGSSLLRWIASGKTILNNKGKPVKQYEPYFSESGHRFEEPREVGVTPVMYYDAAGRLVRTELPDKSFGRVEFSPWHTAKYDPNDTVLEEGNSWYARKTGSAATAEDRRAARLTEVHAGTPAVTFIDSLGREVVRLAHNRYQDSTGTLHEEKYITFSRLDAEGKPLWIRDARKNLVIQFIQPPMPDSLPTDVTSGFVPCYDISGSLLYQHSTDAGDRWMLNDAARKPMYAWDINQRRAEDGTAVDEHRVFYTRYDELHRPTGQFMIINGDPAQLIERFLYGEQISAANHACDRNLRGQLHQHYDQSGLKTVVFCDFKGNPREVRRRLAGSYKAQVIDWQEGSATAGLESETFIMITEYDALNRITRQYNWHRGTGSRVAVYEPHYNRRGLLEREDLVVGAARAADGYLEGSGSRRAPAIDSITYNARGQRELVHYGNGTITRYHYDTETFRLMQLRTTRPGFNPGFPNGAGLQKDARVIQNLYYTYDPVGNITEIYDDAYEPAFFRNQQVEPRSRYWHDALYRLISASGRENCQAREAPGQYEPQPLVLQCPVSDPKSLHNYTQHYIYDSVGNIRELRHLANGGGWTRHYGYAPDNNRLSLTREGDDDLQAIAYRHDTHGNTINLANVAPEYFIRWDYRDMIHTLNLEGGGWAYYNYDADKQRTRKVIESQGGTKKWERLYLGGMEIYRRYSGNRVVEEIEYHHLLEGDRRVLLVEDVLQTDNSRLETGTLYRYQYGNHLGSAVLDLDGQAQIITYEEYYPYGSTSYQAMRSQTETPKRYRYTGKERDGESGLYYHGARYYASWLGRWMSCDPVKNAALSCYVFCSCRPIVNVDPNGCIDERHRVGEIGELTLTQWLDNNSDRYFVFNDSSKGVTKGGFDVFAYDRETDSFVIFDNKAAKELSKVSAFENFNKNIDIAKKVVMKYGDAKEAQLALSAIDESRFRLIASNAFAPDNVKITSSLFKRGYELLDFRTGLIVGSQGEMNKALDFHARGLLGKSAGSLSSKRIGRLLGAAAVLGVLSDAADAYATIAQGEQLQQIELGLLGKHFAELHKKDNTNLKSIEDSPFMFDPQSGLLYLIITDPGEQCKTCKFGDIVPVDRLVNLKPIDPQLENVYLSENKVTVYLDEDNKWHMGVFKDQGTFDFIMESLRVSYHDFKEWWSQ